VVLALFTVSPRIEALLLVRVAPIHSCHDSFAELARKLLLSEPHYAIADLLHIAAWAGAAAPDATYFTYSHQSALWPTYWSSRYWVQSCAGLLSPLAHVASQRVCDCDVNHAKRFFLLSILIHSVDMACHLSFGHRFCTSPASLARLGVLRTRHPPVDQWDSRVTSKMAVAWSLGKVGLALFLSNGSANKFELTGVFIEHGVHRHRRASAAQRHACGR